MSFNSNISKQTPRVTFFKKTQKWTHPTVLFNDIPVPSSAIQKHLSVYLYEKPNFNTHIAEEWGKTSTAIGVIKKLFKSVARKFLTNHLHIIF